LQQIGDDLHVHHFAARPLDQAEHLDVFLEWKRDVQVIDAFALRHFARFGERAEKRQAAVAEVIAGGAIVDEADDLVAELAMFENLVGDQPPELARARDQDPLQSDAGLPPPLECKADGLARCEGEGDIQYEKDRPHRLRDFERAAIPHRVGHVVGLHVQRAEDAEDHRDHAADEHGEEIVDARAAAAQAIETLEPVRHRDERRHEWQHVRGVLMKGRQPFGDRDQTRLEAKDVRDDEGDRGEARVGDDVKGDQKTVISLDHFLLRVGPRPHALPRCRCAQRGL
jgi:hypothetical protein